MRLASILSEDESNLVKNQINETGELIRDIFETSIVWPAMTLFRFK